MLVSDVVKNNHMSTHQLLKLILVSCFCDLIVLCLILPAGFLCLRGIEKTPRKRPPALQKWPFPGECTTQLRLLEPIML